MASGDPENPTVQRKILLNGVPLTSSYEEELTSMEGTAVWLTEQLEQRNILVCSDIQSLLRAIDSGSSDTASIREMLSAITGEITMMPTWASWVCPGMPTWAYPEMR